MQHELVIVLCGGDPVCLCTTHSRNPLAVGPLAPLVPSVLPGVWHAASDRAVWCPSLL